MDIDVTGYQQRLQRKNNGLQIISKILKKHTDSDRMIRRILQAVYNNNAYFTRTLSKDNLLGKFNRPFRTDRYLGHT